LADAVMCSRNVSLAGAAGICTVCPTAVVALMPAPRRAQRGPVL
jgi:hypothetical protein